MNIIVEIQTMVFHDEANTAVDSNVSEHVPSIEARGVTALEEDGVEDGKNEDLVSTPTAALEIDSASTKQQEERALETVFEWAVVVLFLLVWVVLWCLVITDTHLISFNLPHKSRNLLRSLALSPFGVGIRYGLNLLQSRYSLQFPVVKVFPLSTFTCNILAVLIGALLIVYAASWSSWLVPFMTGVLGSLSTVSSFMAEVHVLSHCQLEGIKRMRMVFAARYMLASILCAVLVSQLIFLGAS